MHFLSERDLEAEAPARLFCFPHAGSGAAGFYRWKRLLAPRMAVCPVLLPGREARFAEAPATSLQAVVVPLLEELSQALDRPYALFGHSMGSLLAYECARGLPRTGPHAPAVLFASGRNAPNALPGHDRLHALGDAALTETLRERYGTHGAGLLDDPELRALFLPTVRADLQVVETYRHEAGHPLQCPVQAFAGSADASVSKNGLEAWAAVTTGAFGAQRLPGDHFFHFGEGQAALQAAITALLTEG